MKLVLDSSVIVAAFATRGLCEALFEVCIQSHAIFANRILLGEIRRAFQVSIGLPDALSEEIIRFLERRLAWVEPAEIDPSACRDPNDLHVLGTAVAAQAEAIVTGDKDLLVLKEFERIPILSPREFWERIAK